VSEWFEMQYGVDHFTVSPGSVAVYLKRAQAAVPRPERATASRAGEAG
jgi:hypothetical protein